MQDATRIHPKLRNRPFVRLVADFGKPNVYRWIRPRFAFFQPHFPDPEVVARERKDTAEQGGEAAQDAGGEASPAAGMDRIDPASDFSALGQILVKLALGNLPGFGVERIAVAASCVPVTGGGNRCRTRLEGNGSIVLIAALQLRQDACPMAVIRRPSRDCIGGLTSVGLLWIPPLSLLRSLHLPLRLFSRAGILASLSGWAC